MKKLYNKPEISLHDNLVDVIMSSGLENNGTIGDLLDGESNPWAF